MLDFEPFERPAELYNLPTELLRQLHEQAIRFGFPFMARSRNQVIYLKSTQGLVRVSTSDDESSLMLTVGAIEDPFYLMTRSGFIFWDKKLRSDDIQRAVDELNRQRKSRNWLVENDPNAEHQHDLLSWRVEDIFPDDLVYYELLPEMVQPLLDRIDEPHQLDVVHFRGRSLLCLKAEAHLFREHYRAMNRTDYDRLTNVHYKKFLAQYHPRRYS